jgi:hypothetical protein
MLPELHVDGIETPTTADHVRNHSPSQCCRSSRGSARRAPFVPLTSPRMRDARLNDRRTGEPIQNGLSGLRPTAEGRQPANIGHDAYLITLPNLYRSMVWTHGPYPWTSRSDFPQLTAGRPKNFKKKLRFASRRSACGKPQSRSSIDAPGEARDASPGSRSETSETTPSLPMIPTSGRWC